MLENIYGIFANKFKDPLKSWDSFIEFLALDNCGGLIWQLNHVFDWLFQDYKLCDDIFGTYDSKLLESDYYDHLGNMYAEKFISRKAAEKQGLYLTPSNLADLVSQMTISESDKPIKILDPAVGTGRLLMAAYKKAPDSLCFGVDNDLRLIRIAMTNFAIHNIPGHLLNANNQIHEIDISKENGQYNWLYADRWNSCMNKFKPISRNLNNCLSNQSNS